MKSLVRIKSYPNGLSLHLDSVAEFQDVLSEVYTKFSESSSFFGTTSLPLCLEGRDLTDDEEFQIIESIEKGTRIKIQYLVEPIAHEMFNPEKEPSAEETAVISDVPVDADVTFQRKTVLPGETIECDSDLIIFGNVSKDATVLSKKSIIIYGGLYGKAYAGKESGEEYIITALEFAPQYLSIGDVVMKEKKRSIKWSKKNRFNAQMAFVKNGGISICEITKELLE